MTTASTAQDRMQPKPSASLAALRLGTALATSLCALGAASGPARAQSATDSLPVLSGTQGGSYGAGAGTVITPTATSLDININAQSRVINWQTYNIAAGNTVSYNTTNTTTQYAVLNRVTGVDPGPANAGAFYRSMIDGTLSAQGNIAVWLTNPAGITFGPTGAFNGGSLVLTTLDIGDTDFLDEGSFNLAGASANSITLSAGAGSLVSSGSVILAAQEVSTGKDITGTTGVSLIAAQDVSFSTGIGSPVAFTINTGTTLSGVRVVGTAAISGGSVALAAASPTAVMSTLLGTDSGTSLTATGTSGAVTISSDGGASVGGAVSAVGDYTVDADAVTLGDPVAAVLQQAGGAVSISSASPIFLGGDVTLQGASGTLTGGVAGGGNDLTLNFGGTTAIDGASYTGIGNLSTGGGGTTSLAGTITTTGSQSFGEDVSLAGDTTIVATDASFTSTVMGSQALTVKASGATTFGGAVTAASLTTDAPGTTALNSGSVFTSGTQTFNDAVTLGVDTVLLSTDGVKIGFNGTLDGAQALTVVTSGVSSFNGVVGGTTALTSLTTTGGGTATIGGGAITTTGAQSYGDPLTITADTVFTGGSGSFAGGLAGGGNDAALNFGGTTLINDGVVGIANLSTGGGGTTSLTGTIATSGSQTYGEAVTLVGDTTLSATDASFASTIDGNQSLTVNANGITTFSGAVAIGSLTTDAAGTTALNGGSVFTAGAQTFGDAVTLGADTLLLSTGGATVGLNGTVDGAQSLTVVTSGLTSFGGAEGGGTALTSLTTTAGGTTTISGGAITTSGAQSYGDPVTLGADTVLKGASASFDGGVTGGGFDLALDFGGTTAIDGGFTGIDDLSTLGGGTTTLNGPITTTGSQSYGDAVTLSGNTTLTSSGNAAVNFANTLDGGASLTVNTGGATTFGDAVGATTALTALTTDAGGTTALNGGTVTTAGVQSFGDAVTLGADTTLASTGGGAIGLGGTVNGARALTVNTTGTTTFGGVVGGTTALTSLTTDAGGGTTISGGAVTTSGAQSYGDAVLLGADTVLTGSSGTFNGVDGGGFDLTLALGGTTAIDGSFTNIDDLTSNGGGTTTLGGTITTSGSQTYSEAVTLLAATTLNAGAGEAISFASTLDGAQTLALNATGTTTLGGAVGGITALHSLSTDAGGGTAINGGNVTTTGAQAYGDLVTLGTNTTLTGGSGSFAGVNGGGFDLTLTLGGTTAIDGAFTDIDDLLSNGGGTTTLSGAITTSGSQTYSEAVTLAGDTTLSSSDNATISFASTLDGGQTLVVNTGGATTFSGAVGSGAALTSLATDADGTTALDGGAVTTTGAQSFGDAVTLGADTTLVSTGGGAISLGSTVDGAQALAVNTTGTTTFGGAVGGSTALTSLTTDAGGGTTISGGAVTTSGAQSFGDAVLLGANTVLTSTTSGHITLADTVDGAFSLGVNTAGTTTFGGAVGGTTALASLTTDADGTTALNGGSVITSGAQSYGDTVTLGADTTLSSTGNGAFTLAKTVNGAQALAANTGGATTFGGAVGGTTALTSLSTDTGGTTALNGGAVTTTGGQTYGDAVTLGADTTLTSTANGAIDLVGIVDGAQALSVNTAGLGIFRGAVGGTTALTSLTTDAGGTTQLHGGTVTTTGAQTYNDAIMLSADTTLVAGGAVTLASTVDGAQALTINTSAATTFGGAVGGGTALTSLATDVGGTTAIDGGSVTTTGAQAYGDAVTLGAATTLTSTGGGAISFANTLDSARTLNVTTTGPVTFTGAVGGTAALASLAVDSGDIVATTGITTSGDTTLTSSGSARLASVTATGGNVTVTAASGEVTGIGAGAANLSATNGDVTVTAGTLARLGTVSASGIGSDVTVSGDVVNVASATAGGLIDLAADVGDLTLGTGSAGTTAALTKTGATGELSVTTLTSGGNSTLSSSTAARVGTATASTGTLMVTTGDALTGIAGSRAVLEATAGNVVANAGTSALLGSVTSGTSTALTAGTSLDVTSVVAGTDATLTGASVIAGTVTATNGALSISATAGDLTLGSGSAGTTATLTKTGATGELSVTGSLSSATGTTISSSTNARIASASASGGDVTVTASSGEVTGIGAGAANLSATNGDVSVTAGTLARLGTVSASGAGSDITVTGDVVNVASATAGGLLSLVADAGDVTLGTGSAGTTATVQGSGNATVSTSLTSVDNLTLTAGNGGTASAPLFSATGNGADIAVTGGAISVTTANAADLLTMTATTGDLSLGTGTAGGAFSLSANAAGGDVTVSTSVSGGASSSISAQGDAMVANASTSTGNLQVAAGGSVTGIGSAGANLSAANNLIVTAGPFARLDTASAGNDLTVDANAIAVTSATATAGLLRLAAAAGDVTLGTGSAGTTATVQGSGNAAVTTSLTSVGNLTLTAGNTGTASAPLLSATGLGADIAVAGGTVNVGTANAADVLTLTATNGDLTLGTGSAGSTATLSATPGDIVITSKLVAGGNIALTAGDDIRLAGYDAQADTGLIRSTSGDITADAGGSFHGIGGSDNTLPTSQRGIAALGAGGAISIQSDGDVRFDSLTSGGALAFDVSGSLTGTAPATGAPIGTAIPGGALFATGSGGDITVRTGLADTAGTVNDTLQLDRAVADRNITLSADQLAVGTLTTNTGTITLNDTSAANITTDNYYVGQLNATGDVAVVLTGQTTAATPLVATDANGAPEFFDTAYGKANLTAATGITGTIAKAAQLGAVTFGTALDLDTGALVANSVTSTNGSADILATTGTLSVLTTTLGGGLILTKQGGLATTAGDELRVRSANAGGPVTVNSSTNARTGLLATTNGSVTVGVTNDLTGLAAVSTATSDTAFGRASLTAFGDLGVTVGGLAQLGVVLARNGGNISIAAGNATSDGSIDARSVIANGAASLIATATTPVANAAHDGDILLGSASAATSLLISNTASGGNTGNFIASDPGTLTAGTSLTVNAAGETQLFGDLTSGTDTTVSAVGRAAILGNVTAGGNYAASGSELVLGTSVPRTQQANGSIMLTATSGGVRQGPIDPFAGASPQFPAELTLVANADRVGTEALTVTAAGSINLGDSQLTGGSIAGRESDIVLTAGGDILVDEVDGDRVAAMANGSALFLTIEAGNLARGSDSGLLSDRQTVDIVARNGRVSASSITAYGAGHDIDIAAGDRIEVARLTAGGSLIGRAANNIAVTFATAGEDIALRSRFGTITILADTLAGDDVLLTAAGQINTGSITASGTGPDTRTVTFGPGTLDATYAAETNSGADVVVTSSADSYATNFAVSAASDVIVSTATSATLSTITATAGNVSVNTGTFAFLAGDVTSGSNTSVTAGTAANVRQNVTAGGNYTVTGGTGVTLGDASARTQRANGTVTITASTGDVAQGAGRLTIVSNADKTGIEALSIATNAGSVVLANSQLTGGSIAGRESVVVINSLGGVTVDDVDGDLVLISAISNVVGDTFEGGAGAADLGDLNFGQSIDIRSSGGSVTLNTAQAFGQGHDIDVRASRNITANSLMAGGSIVGRAGIDFAIGTASAGEDVALKSNTSTLTITGATTAGDDVLLTAAGAIATGAVTASGTGPDTRTVTFGAGPLDAAYAAETNASGDIVATSTGASFTGNGALTAASDVSVTTSTSTALLSTTTATAGNVTVGAGTSAQLVGDVTSGANTTITAGTTAAIQQNVTAGGNYTVTGGTGVTLGDDSARTQQANGTVTITATTGDIAKGAGRLTVVSNADKVGTEALTLTASSGNIVLAESQLTGGSTAGRESDVVLTASGAITADDLDGDRVALTAGGNILADTIEAGTGAADLGDLAQRQSVDILSTGGSVTVNTAQAFGTGHDIDVRASTGLSANSLSAGGSLVGRAGNAIAIGTASAGEDVALKSNTGTITITDATTAGDDVLLTAAGAIATGAVTASGTGPDTRTVTFGAGALDAAYAAETDIGGDIVATSTGASFTGNGALTAASDVTVTTSTSTALLSTTTATAGIVTVGAGTSAQLVGDVTSGADTSITAGTTAAIQQNVTAGGSYTVTGGTGVTLGDAQARTQQANGAVTISATTGDIAKGAGRLTVVSNADKVGTEALTLTASSGNIVLAESQFTGGSTAGRESDVVLTASGAITADDLDGDRVALTAGGNILADTIEAGTGAADLGDLAQRQSVDILSTGGSVTVNTAQAFGAGHDIDVRASTGITANGLNAGGSLVGRGGNAIAIGTASAGEDVALRSNTGTITITGATTAGDDVLLTAAGAIATGAVTASGTGPDTRTVTFGAGALDAAYAAETNAGGDIVATSTGASFTGNGALTAASDVTVTTSSSTALLSTTTATAGNVTVGAGTSAQLVGDVTSGGNTSITAGTTAAIQQNVTAGGNYTVTGGTSVTLGDTQSRTQQAKGTVTITATTGDIAKGAGRLTVVSNADRTAANNAEALTLNAAAGNIVLANSQLTGGSTAGRESDIRATARGITLGKVDGASLTARGTTGFATTEAIVAGNAVRGADPVSGASTVDIAVTGGTIALADVTATNTGHDILLNASGAITAANLTAARTVTITGSPVTVTGGITATAGNVVVTGGSAAALGTATAGGSIGVTAGTINVGTATSGTTLNLSANASTLTLGSATSGGDVTLAAATRATLGAVTATGRNVSLSATDADINGNITASQISVLDRSSGANPLRLGNSAPGTGGFALDQTEVNRLNAPVVILDAGTSGTGTPQDVQIGALAIDADTGANRFEIRATRRIDLTGALTATGTGTRVVRIGGGATDDTRATTFRIATTAGGGGRVIVPGVDLDLRADRIGAGQDAGFLANLGLTPGGTPAAGDFVATRIIANGVSALYVADGLNGGVAYTDPAIIRADSLTVRYSDYALFQNTGGSALSAGAELAGLGAPSQPALTLIGPSGTSAGGFAIFGTINGVPGSAAAVLGDQVLTLTQINRLTARFNGCLIGSGSGCIASTTGQPPLPPLNAFRGDIFSTQGDLSIPFDPVVGTNNESLFGDVGAFGLSDLPLQPIECEADENGECKPQNEETRP